MTVCRPLPIAPTFESLGPARAFVEAILADPGLSAPALDQALLITTELLSNAIAHALPPIVLELTLGPRQLVITVYDHSPASAPVHRPPDRSRIGGWGLAIVDALVQEWGVKVERDQKSVWAVLDLIPPGPEAEPVPVSDPRTSGDASPGTP